MRHSEPDIDVPAISQELKLMKERIAILEAAVFGSPQNPVHVAESVDVNDAHITVQRCQGAITIAITSPIKPDAPDSDSFFNPVPSLTPTAPTPLPIPTAASTSPFRPDAPDSATSFFNPVPSPTLTPTAPTPMPIPTALPSTPIPSQNSISSSWGPMMTPGEVQELLASQPQVGEYYVVIKGRRPGVYLSWSDAHELVDGLRSPCHWKKTDKYAALGQYTVAYKKGNCEYRF